MTAVAGASARRYDKGERRLKHVGSTGVPEFVRPSDNPKRVIGKCPNNIPDAERDVVLANALPAPNGDRDLIKPKRLYAVYRGAIYEAQTSDGGNSYHAYPYQGRLTGTLINELQKMAVTEGTLSAFDDWVQTYIEKHGR